jgi:hypothetical protein
VTKKKGPDGRPAIRWWHHLRPVSYARYARDVRVMADIVERWVPIEGRPSPQWRPRVVDGDGE